MRPSCPFTRRLAGFMAGAIMPGLLSVGPASALRPVTPIARAANAILRQQLSDGAIVMGNPAERPARVGPYRVGPYRVGPYRVGPYFAHFAAKGLAAAYRKTNDRRYRDGARAWVRWYEAHMNPDGTVFDYKGAPGGWQPTGDFDSTDSYAALYITLIRDLQHSAPDKAWLRDRYPFVRRAIGAMRLTLQPNGLTIAKPKWPVMYTMDNVEVALGYRAAAEIARVLGKASEAAAYLRDAKVTEAAIERHLWNADGGYYRIGIQTDGGVMQSLSAWYPDQMANLMAIGWLPPSERHRRLFRTLRSRFAKEIPATARTEGDLDLLVWWGYAARSAGDHALARSIASKLAAFPMDQPINNPALLGHLLILAG